MAVARIKPVATPDEAPTPAPAEDPRDDLSRAIDQFAAVEFKTRLTRRAQELHGQIVTLVNATDPLIALGVLRLVEAQLAASVLKE